MSAIFKKQERSSKDVWINQASSNSICPWNSLSMDSITQFPLSNNFDSTIVVVYRFSTMAIFIQTYGTITTLELAQIFISHVFSKHSLPQLKISRVHSTAFHPETDGQKERVNQILEQYPWMYVSYHQDDWYTRLPLDEFAYNNAEHSSKKKSPFFHYLWKKSQL
ncbi:hypothetical protein O181_064738 [Austropuccinia psidii MF-1]|uniref:Integrase catalytic domain-containing protein n=1 Tax=Austropuccinia psidii MF-1 TaxID=1389203 RepID=A0A9Q3I1X3_9BASI|nr:hypothetical protein [Austropuccinia psidii MF-1]